MKDKTPRITIARIKEANKFNEEFRTRLFAIAKKFFGTHDFSWCEDDLKMEDLAHIRTHKDATIIVQDWQNGRYEQQIAIPISLVVAPDWEAATARWLGAAVQRENRAKRFRELNWLSDQIKKYPKEALAMLGGKEVK